MGGKVAEIEQAADDLFATRIKRLEEVTRLLIGLRRDLTQLAITERQQKADIYNANMNVSHGERQGIANAQTAQIATEVLQIKGQIDVLEEERDFLKFCVEWVT